MRSKTEQRKGSVAVSHKNNGLYGNEWSVLMIFMVPWKRNTARDARAGRR
mgnify:CR=1 FL=1